MAEPEPEHDQLQALLAETHAEIEAVTREVREINLLVDQSQGEVDKLAQRSASIAAHLRNLQLNFDTVPRADIRTAYEASQDSLQRLFTMRGQLEKLQSDQTNLERYLRFLKKTRSLLDEASPGAGGANGKEAGPPIIVRVVAAQEAERQRLSRQMHDGPAQALSNFILQAEIAMRLFDNDPQRAREELANMKAAATSTFQRVRDFIFDLRPMMLDDLGLVPTTRRYLDDFGVKSGVKASWLFTGTQRRIESVREVMVFRALQELLGNVRDHAQATQIKVSMDMDEHRVQVIVEDNGKGFDAHSALEAGHKTLGLPALRERIGLLGGELDIDSQPGQGTRVRLLVPAGQAPALA